MNHPRSVRVLDDKIRTEVPVRCEIARHKISLRLLVGDNSVVHAPIIRLQCDVQTVAMAMNDGVDCFAISWIETTCRTQTLDSFDNDAVRITLRIGRRSLVEACTHIQISLRQLKGVKIFVQHFGDGLEFVAIHTVNILSTITL